MVWMICISGVVKSCNLVRLRAFAYVALTDKRLVVLGVGVVVVGGIPELVVAAGADGLARVQAVRARHMPFFCSLAVSPISLGTGYLSGTQRTGARQS